MDALQWMISMGQSAASPCRIRFESRMEEPPFGRTSQFNNWDLRWSPGVPFDEKPGSSGEKLVELMITLARGKEFSPA